MVGHYVRVQDAAALLGVSPATIRWYSLRGWLPTQWVGRGRVAHRRFLYADLQRVAHRTGRVLPAETVWDQDLPVTVARAAQYLGLSARYLTEGGWLNPGAVMTWDDLLALEHQIYVSSETPTTPKAQVDNLKEAIPMMTAMMGQGCGCARGPRGMRGSPASERSSEASVPDETNLRALRRTKRHLEVQKADLEDQLAELDRLIRLHPDNQDPAE